MADETRPRIRFDLDFIPFEMDGENVVLIGDKLGLAGEGRAAPMQLFKVMSLFDGTRTIGDIQAEIKRLTEGEVVPLEQIKGLVEELDKGFLLDSDRYRAARDEIEREFTRAKAREPALSGSGYPDDAKELAGLIDGLLDGARLEGCDDPAAIVAPHIDLSVGAGLYAEAYAAVRGRTPDRVVVLGVGHQMEQGLYCPSLKDFNTPLGAVENDREASGRLIQSLGGGEQSDFAHKFEHSIEFQLLFLQRALGRTDFKVVPVLCGGASAELERYDRDCFLEHAGDFLDALRGVVREPGVEALVVAGVDFCHVGPKFGHQVEASALEKEFSAHDRALLEHLAARDAQGFWAESVRVADSYFVCGFTALATLLEALPESRAKPLGYEIWHEAETKSAVSFAAMAFCRD